MPASMIVMVRPLTFCSNQETLESNSFQKTSTDLTPSEIVSRAQKEFDAFQDVLSSKGITILKYDEVPGALTPDACFPNNWFCQLPDGRVFVFPMHAKNRRGEVRQDILSRIKKSDVIDLSPHADRELFLEGTGSLILDHTHKLAYACLSPRTSPFLLKEFSKLSGYEAVSFSSHNEEGKAIYHTNVMMALGEKNVVINMSSINTPEEKEKLLAYFLKTGKYVVDISHEQMNSFAGNMLLLSNNNGENFWVMSTRAYESLTYQQKVMLSSDGTLLHSAIPTIEDYGGGGVRCLMAEIFIA